MQAELEYMAIMSLSEKERIIHSATMGDAESIAHNNIVMAKVRARGLVASAADFTPRLPSQTVPLHWGPRLASRSVLIPLCHIFRYLLLYMHASCRTGTC